MSPMTTTIYQNMAEESNVKIMKYVTMCSVGGILIINAIICATRAT